MEMELNLKLEHADSSRHWSHSLDTEEDQGESMGQGSDAGAANTSLMTIMWACVIKGIFVASSPLPLPLTSGL